MKLLLILPCLVGFLHAKVVHRYLDILEGDVTYRQTVTLDYEKNIQIVEVPAHNSIVHSRTIFDFNKGKLFESHPESKICYVRDIPEGTADLKTFDNYLQKKTVKLTAGKEKRITKAFTTSRKLNFKMFPTMASEIIEECIQSEIYEVTEVPIDTRKTTTEVKKASAYERMMRTRNGCSIPDGCVWQTCQYGTDSCYWTVQCRPQADQPEEDCEVYHSRNLHNGHNQISCKVCFNLACPGCPQAWKNPACHDMLIASKIDECIDDPTYGGDCKDLSEPHCYLPEYYFPEDATVGEYNCPTGDLDKGIVKLDGTCVYICANNMYGGTLTCKTRNGGKEGVFDKSDYHPENC